MSKKKKTALGADPLDAFLTPQRASQPKKERGSSSNQAKKPEITKKARSNKVRATFYISEDVLEAIRNTAFALSGPPHRLTMAGFAEEALKRELQRMVNEHNGGEEFPERSGEMRVGRRVGS